MKLRGFEIITAYKEKASPCLNVPPIMRLVTTLKQRKKSWCQAFESGRDRRGQSAFAKETKTVEANLDSHGDQSLYGEDEYLQLTNRSSNPLKRFLVLTNGVGVIDSDYYDNPDNEGHIMFQFTNFGPTDVVIKKANGSAKEFSCRS